MLPTQAPLRARHSVHSTDRRRLPCLSFAPEFGPLQIHGRIPFSLDSSAYTRRSQVTSGPWTELNESLYWRTYVRAVNKNDVASLKGLPEMAGMLKCKPKFLPEASLGSSSSWVVLVWVWRVVVSALVALLRWGELDNTV